MITKPEILVIRGGAIGDFILTLPVLAALRQQFPTVKLTLLGYPRIAELARVGGLVDEVKAIESPGLAGFFARSGQCAPEWQAFFSRFEIILSYLYDPDGLFEANVKRCQPRQYLSGPFRPPETGGRHATEVLLQPLERLAVAEADPTPRLVLPERGESRAAGQPPLLAVHPGSGSASKNWPETAWRDLLEAVMTRTAWRVLLVGGEAEGDRLERLAAPLPRGRREVLRGASLVEVGQRLGQCAAFAGHDSGITHLAAAVGLAGVALWGPSVEEVWRPRSARFTVLKSPAGLAGIDPRQVLAALELAMAGHPARAQSHWTLLRSLHFVLETPAAFCAVTAVAG